jgi:proteic killer suppression protein
VDRRLQEAARVKLRILNDAVLVDDLRLPPSNRLEKLAGDRQGLWSFRVNRQWRICFRWVDGDAFDVELVDYH